MSLAIILLNRVGRNRHENTISLSLSRVYNVSPQMNVSAFEDLDTRAALQLETYL